MTVSKSDIAHVIIDGDAILYKAVARRKRWLYKNFDNSVTVCDHEVPGSEVCHMFLPLEESKKIVDSKIKEIYSQFPNAKDCVICFGGDDNFRLKVATSKPYKGNRVSERPVFYHQIKEHIEDSFHCYSEYELEADDSVGILNQRYPKGTSVMCHIDKDLDMLPGNHYNLDKGTFYSISELEAWRCFFTQTLTGDPSDNIPGIYGVGEKKALTYLEGCKSAREMMTQVGKVYKEYFKGVHPELRDQYMIEQFNLLWILRDTKDKLKQWFKYIELDIMKGEDQ